MDVVYRSGLLWGRVRFDEHLAELLELLRSPNLLSEEWELNDMEELVIKLVGFFEILLLHLVPHLAVLTVRVWLDGVSVDARLKKVDDKYALCLGNRSWLTTILCVSISYAVSSCTSRSVSYNDKNSEMHTHTNVVFSCRVKESALILGRSTVCQRSVDVLGP